MKTNKKIQNEAILAYLQAEHRHSVPFQDCMRFLKQFQQYFSFIAVISFIGGGNRSTGRKPQTCIKSLTNFIT
jgi:hypothetical protein